MAYQGGRRLALALREALNFAFEINIGEVRWEGRIHIHSLAKATANEGPNLTTECTRIVAEAEMSDVNTLDRSPFGINCHEASDEMLDQLADVGIRWFRFDLEWRKVEPQRGQYDWGTTRRIVEWADRRGVSLLAVMAYAPQWAWAPKEQVEYEGDNGMSQTSTASGTAIGVRTSRPS